MPWVRLDDQFYNHPKVASLGWLMLPAVGLHTLALCYCNAYLTDGFVPDHQIGRLAGDLTVLLPDGDPKTLVEALVRANLWERKAGGYSIHDFLDYNPSKRDVVQLRKIRAEVGRVGGKQSAKQKAKQMESKPLPTDQAAENQNSTPAPSPFPYLNQTEKKETKEETTLPRLASRSNGLPPGFMDWWNQYPKKVGRIQAVKEWVKLNPDETLQATMMSALLRQKATVRAMVEGDKHHILDPERWIKYRRWEDDIMQPAKVLPKSTQQGLAALEGWKELGERGKTG